MDKVSVIVPIYNAASYIRKLMESLLSQTYENVEIILVDDGSSDESAKIIESYIDNHEKKIKFLKKQNGGAASARNTGLRNISGDYVLFLDSDDYIDSNCIDTLMNKLKEKKADIIRFRMCYVYESGESKLENMDFKDDTIIYKQDFKNEIYIKMLSGIRLNTVIRTIYRRDLIDNLKFREDLITAEDLVFNMEAYTRANSFLYLGQVYYYYYQSNRGLTGSGISVFTKYRCNFIVTRELLKYLKAWHMNTIWYKTLTIFRIIFITIFKIKRRLFK